MQRAAEIMPNGGRIVNISTLRTSVGFPNYSVYVASKSALEGFTLVLASELAPRGITINTVSPGSTETVMLEKLLNENPDGMEAMFVQRTPMGRIGKPQEIADVVAFLASDDARWVTGQNLRVDGGFR